MSSRRGRSSRKVPDDVLDRPTTEPGTTDRLVEATDRFRTL